MKHNSNIERGMMVVAYLPDCVKKNQDSQKDENSKIHKSKMRGSNFSKEFSTKKIGRFSKKQKAIAQINEKESCSSKQIVPKSELDRQIHFYNSPIEDVKKTEKEMQLINFEFIEKDIKESKSKYAKPKAGSLYTELFYNNANEWYKPNLNPVEISDCGFTASWVYDCIPWKNFEKCVENITEGAWVPYPVMYGYKYEQCKDIQNSERRQFSEDYNGDYK
jgi:hypothetical protein